MAASLLVKSYDLELIVTKSAVESPLEADILELKDDIWEMFDEDLAITLTYHQLYGGSLDSTYGIVKTENTVYRDLLGVVIINPQQKLRREIGVSSDASAVALIPTRELSEKNVTLDRERGWIVYESVRYEILKIDPKPVLFDTSVITIVELGKEKPLKD